ncbi:MAG: RagB/SusD family nutrient uptake outer membrane protein [Bacteroidetes bacterium]|nr:MAG: RagB/SusD family nutrient uptake outer membrane protein [Bacteroidota bacterium]
MKKIIKNVAFALAFSSAVALQGCKGELDVKNLNNPALSTVVADAGSVANIPFGGALSLYNAMDGVGLSTLDITGDYMSSSWGNFGMRDLGTQPRAAYNNSVAYSNAGDTNLNLWRNLNSALGSAREPLVLINVEGKTLDKDGTRKITNSVKAVCEYLQGVSLGYLSLFFDKAFIFDERTPLNANISLTPASQVRDAAIAKLDACIATCNANTFVVKVFNGRTYNNAQLAQIARTMAARILAYHPRTPAESASVDWNKVKTYTQNGLDFDFIVNANANNYVTNARWLLNAGVSDDTFWSRIDQRIVSLMSTNGLQNVAPTGQPMVWGNTDLDSLDHNGAVIQDERFTTDWVRGDPPFIAGRGRYFFSQYFHNRYTATVDIDAGPCHLALKAENDLLYAEALIRTSGSTTEAATRINITRQGRGKLPALTGSETNLLAYVLYERSIELMNSMAGIGFLDNRRMGYIDTSTLQIVPNYFTPGTIPHYPVPALELTSLKLPIYTFGGN